MKYYKSILDQCSLNIGTYLNYIICRVPSKKVGKKLGEVNI